MPIRKRKNSGEYKQFSSKKANENVQILTATQRNQNCKKVLVKITVAFLVCFAFWQYLIYEPPVNLEFDFKDKIALVEYEMRRLCKRWPHNDYCFMLARSVNPIPEKREDGMTLTTKMLVKKLLTGDRDVTLVATGTSHTAGKKQILYIELQWCPENFLCVSLSRFQ